MPSVVYHSGAENFRGLLSGVSERKPCKKKILTFINAPCKLLVECRLIVYPSQACSVSHSHTAEVATKGRSSFLGADISSFSPIIARPYNLGGKKQNKHNFMQVEVRTLHRMFCPSSISVLQKFF